MDVKFEKLNKKTEEKWTEGSGGGKRQFLLTNKI
jgi:hypothetical protein